MSKDAQPYTAIPGYFEKSPQELSAIGGPMEYSPRLTALARGTLNLAFSDIIIEDADFERYLSTNPAVAVPPHRSGFDLSVLSRLAYLSGEGQPYFLSKRQNMDNRLSAKFYGRMRTFPIDRDMPEQNWTSVFSKWCKFALSDGADYKEFEGLTDKPRKLIIFGEGGRKTGPLVYPMYSGPLVAAKRNKAPILPVGIAGTDGLKLRNLPAIAVITVGEPYYVSDVRDTETLQTRVQEQLDRANEILLKQRAKILTK